MPEAATQTVSFHSDSAKIDTAADFEIEGRHATPGDCQRAHPRHPTKLHVLIYARGRFQTTTISDLSLGGACLRGAFGVMPHDKVSLQLLDGRKLNASVRWWVNGHCGVVFEHPLQPDDALIQHALKRKHALGSS